MYKNFIRSVFFFSLLFKGLLAQSVEMEPVQLHEILGYTIDQNENQRYQIFGRIEGLVNVRIYRLVASGRYRLYFFRNTTDGIQVAIYEITFSRFFRLKYKLKKRIKKSEEVSVSFKKALLSVPERIWGEPDALKEIQLTNGSKIIGRPV